MIYTIFTSFWTIMRILFIIKIPFQTKLLSYSPRNKNIQEIKCTQEVKVFQHEFNQSYDKNCTESVSQLLKYFWEKIFSEYIVYLESTLLNWKHLNWRNKVLLFWKIEYFRMEKRYSLLSEKNEHYFLNIVIDFKIILIFTLLIQYDY